MTPCVPFSGQIHPAQLPGGDGTRGVPPPPPHPAHRYYFLRNARPNQSIIIAVIRGGWIEILSKLVEGWVANFGLEKWVVKL
jgi:hypothetical protein